MAPFSGKDGTVTAGTSVAEVTKWSAETSAAIDKWGSSSSNGWKNGVAGTKDVKGSVEAKIDEDDGIPFDEGDTVSMTLSTGAEAAGSLAGSALIASISYEVDVDTGKAVGFTANFEGIGEWTKTGTLSKAGGGSES